MYSINSGKLIFFFVPIRSNGELRLAGKTKDGTAHG